MTTKAPRTERVRPADPNKPVYEKKSTDERLWAVELATQQTAKVAQAIYNLMMTVVVINVIAAVGAVVWVLWSLNEAK